MTDTIANPKPIVPAAQSPSAVPSEETMSLGSKYSVLAAEFRELNRKQMEGNLNPDEMQRKRELDEMAGYGLFILQNENLLAERERIYLSHCKLDLEEGSNPEVLSDEYRELGKKWLDQGLKPDEIERYMHLQALSRRGLFEQVKAAV